jgi:hypothetical protein
MSSFCYKIIGSPLSLSLSPLLLITRSDTKASTLMGLHELLFPRRPGGPEPIPFSRFSSLCFWAGQIQQSLHPQTHKMPLVLKQAD